MYLQLSYPLCAVSESFVNTLLSMYVVSETTFYTLYCQYSVKEGLFVKDVFTQ